MSNGLVYILTNPCLDGWVKIGMTQRNDIERRLQELNAPTNIPLSYRCYATYEVDNPAEVEKRIHSIIDRIDDSLHAREHLENGRIREREFFKISPEAAYGIFKDIAILRNDVEKLKLYTPTLSQSQEEELAERRTKRSNNSFKLLNIGVGEEIAFLYDDNIKATVLNEKNQIEFNGESYSVTALARKILIEKYGWSDNLHSNGWRFFTIEGITLSDLRDRIENSELDE
ncbi:MAG: GIY-YIG nuclease family protein [Lachnospiraceae bacterium]|nr:GIY-YIG nuclease family protein [Lachnospiraceae bacterium]